MRERGAARRSRVLARPVSLAQTGELARRLSCTRLTVAVDYLFLSSFSLVVV